jgi:hypothetical protein
MSSVLLIEVEQLQAALAALTWRLVHAFLVCIQLFVQYTAACVVLGGVGCHGMARLAHRCCDVNLILC